MPIELKPGDRFRSTVCEAEVVVVRAPSTPCDLRCGGHPMVPIDAEAAGGGEPATGFDGGCLLGKRYTEEAGELEVLCTKPGAGALSVGDVLLDVKGAKPLPSSD